uniref:Uncharacterized protein n=1 Tax=Timema monikensis TaxID=170555 RepID=A0A7R9EJJ3_9NEOP|nr:unnamed protein product [Timema monikensis]
MLLIIYYYYLAPSLTNRSGYTL